VALKVGAQIPVQSADFLKGAPTHSCYVVDHLSR